MNDRHASARTRRARTQPAQGSPPQPPDDRDRLLHDLQVHQVEIETQNRELREAQRLLELSRDRYADLYDFAPVGFVTLDAKGLIRELNLTAATLLGSERARLIGLPFQLHLARSDLQTFRIHLRSLSRPDEFGSAEVWLAPRSGRSIRVLLRSWRVMDTEEPDHCCRIAITDITARHHAEDSLRASEARFRSLSEASPLGICMTDIHGHCTYTNPCWQDTSGLSREENLREGWSRVVHPNDRPRLSEEWTEAVRTRQGLVSEFRIVRPDGTLRWIRARTNPIIDANGNASGHVCVVEDITFRKLDEQRRQLQHDVSRLMATADSLGEAVPTLLRLLVEALELELGEFWEADAPGRQLRVVHIWHAPGKKLAAFVERGLKRSIPLFDGLPGRVFSTRKPDWIQDISECPIYARRREAAQAGLRSALAFPVVLNRQTLGVMAFLSGRVTEPDEDLLQMLTGLGSQIGQFIERKKAEEALRDANEFSKQVINGAQAGIIVCDSEARITVWNPFMEQLTGYPAEGLLGRRAMAVFPFLRAQPFADLVSRAMDGEVFEAPDIPLHLPGKAKLCWIAARVAPRRDTHGKVVGAIVAVRDITERRRLEAELLGIGDRERQRIGHDLHDGLGQQLTALEMKCFLLMENLAAADLTARRESLRESVQELSQALRECITLTRSLARGLAPVKLEADGLAEALKLLAHRTSVPGKLECHFVCRCPVTIDDSDTAGHLYRIAQEAVNNALKHARTRRIDISLAHDQESVCLQVRDHGRGLPGGRRSKSGMGLDVMRHRAHVLGATLAIDSKRGQGVTITCILPPRGFPNAHGLPRMEAPTRRIARARRSESGD